MSTYPQQQLLQTLSSILIEINALQSRLGSPAGTALPAVEAMLDGLRELEQMARQALVLARASIEELVLPELEGMTLAEALSRLVEEQAERLGLASRVSFSGVDEQGHTERALSPLAERLIFLVAQEALYQVQLKGSTRRLRLTLNYGRDDVLMGIEDDGVARNSTPASGTETAATSDQLADALTVPPFAPDIPIDDTSSAQTALTILHDLRARLESAGGSLTVSAVGERGTSVQARLPYRATRETQPALLPSEIQSPDSQEPSMRVEEVVVRILIVDSHAVTRAGLHRLLESYPGLVVIGEAADGVQSVSETLELGPQLVLMDTQLPAGQSLEALRQIKQLNLGTKVLLLAAQDHEEFLYEMLRAGADGYLLKDSEPDELAHAVRAVARGEILFQPQLAGKLLSRYSRQDQKNAYSTGLTTRELEVLRLLVKGLRNKEIAARLYVSERTVNFHLANIYQKLNVSSRTEALSKALEQGLIT